MSWWTHIMGVIQVSPAGRTQHEMTYILNTVLDHLPQVTGSEGNMKWFVNVNEESNISCSHDEFGVCSNNLVDIYGCNSYKRGWLRYSNDYYLTVYGDLRDRVFSQTFREFQKWLCRLSKRIKVESISVIITSDDRDLFRIESTGWDNPYSEMYEWPSWVEDSGEPSWYEYLMWEKDSYSGLPISHIYKYYNDEDVDTEIERRNKWKENRVDSLFQSKS